MTVAAAVPHPGTTERTHPAGRIGGAVLAAGRSRITTRILFAAMAVQATLLALIGRRSIYDEDTHMVVIQHFATGASPFASQPATLLQVGDISRRPYLYHWAMGQLYRLFTDLGLDSTAAWLSIRVVSALLASSVVVFAWLTFRELGFGAGVSNAALFLTVATPLLVYVASIVNPDGVGNALLALSALLAVRLYNARTFHMGLWLGGLVAIVATALTKGELLLFLAPLVLVVAVRQVITARGHIGADIRDWYAGRGALAVRRWALTIAAVVALALFVERFGVNLVQFQAPIPACDAVQSHDVCYAWGPWRRNYQLDAAFPDAPVGPGSLVPYLFSTWLPEMSRNLTLIGVVSTAGVVSSFGPSVTGWIVTYVLPVGLAVTVVGLFAIRVRRGTWMIVTGIVLMLATQFWANYTDYLRLGVPVAIQGRYVLPFVPFLAGFLCYVLARTLGALPRGRSAASLLVVIALVGATQGGGALSFLARSDQTWWTTQDGWTLSVTETITRGARGVVARDVLMVDPRL